MKIKDYLKKNLDQKIEEQKSVREALVTEENKETRATLGATLDTLEKEIAEARKALEEVDEPADNGEGAEGNEGRKMSVLSTMQTRTAKQNEGTASMEYRKAFKRYMATGKMEYRADETTMTTDNGISAVIPENLINKIIEKYEQLGVIYNLVTRTAYPVGQAIPVDGLKPTATWVGRATSDSGEGKSSDSIKKNLGARIVFANYKLRCEIRYTEEVDVMTLPAFEELFVRQVGEAMLRAQEYAIVEGDGIGMPTGILNETPEDGKALEVKAGVMTYEKLCECEAAVPVQYETATKWCMTKKTFMSFVGMVDSYGQPIARVNYGIGGKPERTLLGRDVVIYAPQSGSKLTDFSASSAGGSLVAFLFAFNDYVLNTNYDLGISHARDWDNEDHKTKAVLACDGKVIDKGSLVTLSVANA